MPVKFNVVQRGNPGDPSAPKQFYPSIESTGRVTTRQMVEQAARESTLSPADMMAAIEMFLSIVPLELAKGNIVELGDFGNFWLKTTSDGALALEQVQPGQITSLLPRFMPGKNFKKALSGVEFVKGELSEHTEEDD